MSLSSFASASLRTTQKSVFGPRMLARTLVHRVSPLQVNGQQNNRCFGTTTTESEAADVNRAYLERIGVERAQQAQKSKEEDSTVRDWKASEEFVATYDDKLQDGTSTASTATSKSTSTSPSTTSTSTSTMNSDHDSKVAYLERMHQSKQGHAEGSTVNDWKKSEEFSAEYDEELTYKETK